MKTYTKKWKKVNNIKFPTNYFFPKNKMFEAPKLHFHDFFGIFSPLSLDDLIYGHPVRGRPKIT